MNVLPESVNGISCWVAVRPYRVDHDFENEKYKSWPVAVLSEAMASISSWFAALDWEKKFSDPEKVVERTSPAAVSDLRKRKNPWVARGTGSRFDD
jgi:hypothetical protein